jgi:hypothetical protein
VAETIVMTERDPFAVDPSIVERGVRGHRRTEGLLADYIKSLGGKPRSPKPTEPQYDVLWQMGNRVFVAEVKSITDLNEQHQIRYGLGQVLHYRHLLSSADRVAQAVLVVEREPRDPAWLSLCAAHGVIFVWPGHFEPLAGVTTDR